MAERGSVAHTTTTLHIPPPTRIAVDADIGRPAVEADMWQLSRGMILADSLQPERAELNADDLTHAEPHALVE